MTHGAAARYRWRVDTRTQLSPGGAIAIGLACGGMGTFCILMALGVFGDSGLSEGTPPWVGVCAGLVFVLGGLAVIVGYGIAGGAGPDGDLVPGTPFVVRLVQTLLGLGITVLLALIATWVAFGPGARHFTGAGSIGGVAVGGGSIGELFGRVVFGLGAVLVWAFAIVMLVVSVKRLRRS